MVARDSSLSSAQQQASFLFDQGRADEALAVLDALQPLTGPQADWLYNRALLLAALHRDDEAVQSFSLARQAGFPASDVWCQEGTLWKSRGALQQALQCYDRALQVDPSHHLAWFNRGGLLLVRNEYAAARDSLDAAHAFGGVWPGLPGARCLARRHLAQWDASMQQLLAAIDQGLCAGSPVCEPFTLLALVDAPAQQRTAARLWLERSQARHRVRSAVAVRRGEKLRIGYFSSDFHDHATLHLLAGVLEQHDRRRVEVVCFSWGPPTRDVYQRRAMAAVDAFVEVHGLHDVAVADQARALEIDIAVDLKGATHDARPGIFAARAAPVQVNYLGYPGTMGMPWWDYIVADSVVVPPQAYGDYQEKIACLPHSYQPNDATRVRPTEPPSRASCGLPEAAVVLVCFNAQYKIGPEVFACWMEILRRVPAAVLWLLQGHPDAQRNLHLQAQALGVAPERLVFAPFLPQAQHLARLPLADLMLDTWPCNAHTTASDALWMGVPVLTRLGQSFAARVAASSLHALGLADGVCTDAAAYVERAVNLATDDQQLRQMRNRLSAAREHAPLFDTARYTRSLEAAFFAMAERHRAGLPPEHFCVQEPTPHTNGSLA